jgi:hypothetical protein
MVWEPFVEALIAVNCCCGNKGLWLVFCFDIQRQVHTKKILLYIMDTNSRTCGRKERVGCFLKDLKHFFQFL